MAIYRFTNNATSTLAGDVTAGATSISVASAAPFPTSGNFTVIVGTEIMLVTGVSGTVFTVSRGQESTSAAAHSAGDSVQHVLTADTLNDLVGASVPSGTSFPTGPSSGDRFYRSDRHTEYYYDGSQWLSTQLLTAAFGVSESTLPATITSDIARLPALLSSGGATNSYLVDWYVWYYVAGSNDASNYWTVNLRKTKESAPISTLIDSISTAGGSGNLDQSDAAAINAALGLEYRGLLLDVEKVGAPGSIYVAAFLTFRLIG